MDMCTSAHHGTYVNGCIPKQRVELRVNRAVSVSSMTSV